MKGFTFTLSGVTPLLINRFHEEAQAESTAHLHGRKEYPEPLEDARERLYQLEGVPYYPAENLRQSIITAAGRHKIGRRSAASDLAAAVYIEPYALPLTGEWEVDSRPVVIPATKGRLVRHRPIFKVWQITGTVQYDERLIAPKLLRDCVNDAGDYVGIGDFRPQKKGPYGRFSVVHWEAR